MPNQVKHIIFDGHNDVLERLTQDNSANRSTSFFKLHPEGHLDYPRAKKAGFAGGFFAIHVPAEPNLDRRMNFNSQPNEQGRKAIMEPPVEYSRAQRITLEMMAKLFQIENESAGTFKIVRNVRELKTCLQQNIMAAVLHFEGAEAIDPTLDALYVFHAAGLRSLGLVWSRPNPFGHGVPFQFPHSPDTGPGLTEFGRNLVHKCNDLGILIDLSHLNAKGFWDVAEISSAPLVATHTAVHAISPSTRNLTDEQLDAIGQSKGVVGLNFHVADLRPDGKLDKEIPLETMVRHVDHIVERIGIDHIALGSDFDGALIPKEIKNVSGLPKLIRQLSCHGYHTAALKKICYRNWVRVLEKTWK